MKRFLPVLCALLVSVAGAVVNPVTDGKTAIAEVQGKIVQMDERTQRLDIEDTAKVVWSVQLTAKTRIIDSENRVIALSQLKPAQTLRIYFNTEDRTARQIDVVRSLVDDVIVPK